MNVYPWLRKDSPYHRGDIVHGVVYETSRNFGAFVAVDSIFSALVPRRWLKRELKAGDEITAYVAAVKPDGKLDLSLYAYQGEAESGLNVQEREAESAALSTV